MPTVNQFRLPDTLARWTWPRALNPYYEECKAESAAWCASHKAFPARAQKAFDLCDFNLLASLAYPLASKDGCRIGCDLMNLFFVYDEHSDAMDADSVRVWAAIIMDALRNPHKQRPAGEPVVGEVTRTFWLNAIKTASKSSQRRFIETFDTYTQSVVQQAEDRDNNIFRDVESYMTVRRDTIGAKPSFALLEMDMELPDYVINHPLLVDLSIWCIDMLILGNDICSYNVEQSRADDAHNIVKLIMLQENTDVHGAMQYILGMHDGLADNFLQNYDKLPSWGEPIDSWVHRYVDGLGNWVRANDSWSFESWRYFKNDGLNIQKHRWVTLLPPVEDDELTSSIAPESRYILSAVIPKRPRPENVGIVAMDMYIPKRCISERDLEIYDNVPEGKYTIGLGQEYMAFVDDREDINSLALTVVSSLLRKYNIDPRSIGRIDVGTETMLDKSKSVKSHLMDLFTPCGNTDIEGIDSKHACYGSTAALFNAVNWVESSSWDGRYAIVFAGDIAVYSEGAARPVGGAGACAMLVGPNAPIIIEPIHGTHMSNTYDFYKPKLDSEYPYVDGALSIDSNLTSLDQAYRHYCQKSARFIHNLNSTKPYTNGAHTNGIKGKDDVTNGHAGNSGLGSSLTSFDYMIFHSPYGKMVQKSFARLVLHEVQASSIFSSIDSGGEQKATPTSKHIEKVFLELSAPLYTRVVAPSMACAKRCGNMYTGSLYGGLASLISSVEPEQLKDKRISMFAFGAGAAATFFSLRVVGDTSGIRKKMALQSRLDAMEVVPCAEWAEALKFREQAQNVGPYTPQGRLDHLWQESYYLESVDERYKRKYAIRE